MRHNLAWKKKKSSARPAKLLPLIPEKYHMMMPFMMMSSGVLFPPGPGIRGRPSRRAELAKKHLAGGRRQRFAEHVPLDAVATLLPQPLLLGFRFDPFGNDGQPQGAGQGNDGGRDGGVAAVLRQVTDEGTVDFHDVD